MKASSIGSFDSFWKWLLVAGGFVAWSLPVWNLVVNPYQVFAPSAFSIGDRFTSSKTNERFLKVEFLLDSLKNTAETPQAIVDKINGDSAAKNSLNKTPSKYDAFIVGSSIMGAVDPALVNRLFQNRTFYNLSFLAAKPDEILATLKGLKRRGQTIKTVVYGLEPIAFTDSKYHGLAYQLHPEADEKSRNRIIFDYLFAPSFSDGLGHLLNVINKNTFVKYDIKGSGTYSLQRYDREIAIDHNAFIEKQFPVLTKTASAPPWINSRFDGFRKLVEWLKTENIEPIFYLNPLHPQVAAEYGAARLAEFQKKLQVMGGGSPIRDCTSLLNNGDFNERFYDYTHFRPTETNKVIHCGVKEDFYPIKKTLENATFQPDANKSRPL